MLSFLYRKKTNKSKKPNRSTSPSPSSIDNIEIDDNFEEFVHFDTLTSELQTAKKEITSLLETKKLLEVQLSEKEKENKLLLEKISALTFNVETEKNSTLQQKEIFIKQEKTLENQIVSLRSDLYEKEKQHRLLIEKISALESILQEITILQQKNKLQHEQYLEKEREYAVLINKTAELELSKNEIAEALAKEKLDHTKTKEALGKEKDLRLSKEQELEFQLKEIQSLETQKKVIEQTLAKEQFEHKKTQDLLLKEKILHLTNKIPILTPSSTNKTEIIPPIPKSGVNMFPYRSPENTSFKHKLFDYHTDIRGYSRYLW